MNEIKGIAGKLVCHDETTGHWFLISQEKIKELQDQMNKMIIDNPRVVTIQDVIDILNEKLPEDQKITTELLWSNVSLFTDDFRYEYCGFRYKHNGLDILELGFVPCESTEGSES